MDLHKFNIIIPPQDVEEHPGCLKKITAGDRNAYEWLYKNYCTKLYDYLLLLTGDAFFTEDLVQEVFLKIWTNKEKLITVSNFNSYLYMTAKNLLLDKWKKVQNEKAAIKNIETTQPRVEYNLFYQRNEERRVDAAIKTLSPRQEQVYRMIREEGRTREEVSKELKISPNTVKATMQCALAELRVQLKVKG